MPRRGTMASDMRTATVGTLFCVALLLGACAPRHLALSPDEVLRRAAAVHALLPGTRIEAHAAFNVPLRLSGALQADVLTNSTGDAAATGSLTLQSGGFDPVRISAHYVSTLSDGQFLRIDSVEGDASVTGVDLALLRSRTGMWLPLADDAAQLSTELALPSASALLLSQNVSVTHDFGIESCEQADCVHYGVVLLGPPAAGQSGSGAAVLTGEAWIAIDTFTVSRVQWSTPAQSPLSLTLEANVTPLSEAPRILPPAGTGAVRTASGSTSTVAP